MPCRSANSCGSRRVFTWVMIATSTGCATSLHYASFQDVEYGYAEARTIWSPRARLRVHAVEARGGGDAARAIVLLHPWGYNAKVWRDVALELSRSYRVIAVDLPGHGKSDKLAGPHPIGRLAAAVVDVLEDRGVERAIVAGNSLGGAISVATALAVPERTAGLVLIGAPGGEPVFGPLRRAARSMVTPRSIASLSPGAWSLGMGCAHRSDGPLARELRDDLLALRGAREWPAWARCTKGILASVAAYTPPLEHLSMPALVVHGDADPIIPASASASMAARIPKGELVVLEDCGHLPEVECPRRLVAVIRGWIRRVGFEATQARAGLVQ